jgi:hypothetical protein
MPGLTVATSTWAPPLATLTQTCSYGAICQGAMIVVRSEDQAAARAAYFSEIRAILRGLARGTWQRARAD